MTEYKSVVSKIVTGLGAVYVQMLFDESGNLAEIIPTVGKSGGSIMVKSQIIGILGTELLRLGCPPALLIAMLRGMADEKPCHCQGYLLKSLPDAIAFAIAQHLGMRLTHWEV